MSILSNITILLTEWIKVSENEMQHPIDPFSCILFQLSVPHNCTDTLRCFFCLPRTPLPPVEFSSPPSASARSHFYPNIDVTNVTRKRPQLSTRNPFTTMTSSRGAQSFNMSPLLRSLSASQTFLSHKLGKRLR